MKTLPILLPSLILLFACGSGKNETHTEQRKSEVIETEKAFAKMAREKGIDEAFINYADEEAVLLRSNKLIKGKAGIVEYFGENNSTAQVKLDWAPDFVDVAASGDMAYTYGKYIYTKTDSAGTVSQEGIFHTVWKRQDDGSWRYVWD